MNTSRDSAAVLLVDDHPIVRRGLAALLSGQPWVERIDEADSIESGLVLARTAQPDVAVVDLGLPDGDGLELVSGLRAALPSCATLVLTMTAEAGRARAALQAGANGYLAKETEPDVVIGAIHTIWRGGLVVGPRLDRDVVVGQATPSTFGRLTPRELEILGLLGGGRSNIEIARRLGVADKTVRNQVSGILVKIGARDRVHAAILAREHGLG